MQTKQSLVIFLSMNCEVEHFWIIQTQHEGLKSNTENKGKFLSFSLEVTLTTTKYNPVNCYDSVFERTLKCQEI